MITVIVGPQGCGKTMKASELAKGRKTVNDIDGTELFKTLDALKTPEVECVIVDDVFSIKTVDHMLLMATRDDAPDVIITSNVLTSDDLKGRDVQVIDIGAPKHKPFAKILNSELYGQIVVMKTFTDMNGEQEDAISLDIFVKGAHMSLIMPFKFKGPELCDEMLKELDAVAAENFITVATNGLFLPENREG